MFNKKKLAPEPTAIFTPEQYANLVRSGIAVVRNGAGKPIPQDPTANYIVLCEEWFHPIEIVLGDTIEFTFKLTDPIRTETIFKHVYPAVYTESVNYTKILRYDEFHGVKNALVWVIGHKEKLK